MRVELRLSLTEEIMEQECRNLYGITDRDETVAMVYAMDVLDKGLEKPALVKELASHFGIKPDVVMVCMFVGHMTP